ncbi:DHA2 family efflux MFS transporter permease subunit [Nonomuraea sediminis]|uniref:DHA2 family efflux MFS transporter permease subunit n=1 Tax=Nonomuraea sediminis TaxID=2835864 RepID=UPI001BDC07C0|nr:DHA2 family efflux MFS transporter permease subunit [Nonomuraea sediminis]
MEARARTLTVVGLCLALFMTLLDSTVVNLALPAIAEDLDVRIAGLQWIIDAYILVFASLLLSAGALGDRWGRRRVFIAGMVVFCAGSLVCALAGSLAVLVAGRMVQGMGAAALLPGTMSILAAAFPDERERAKAIGIWSGTSGLALLLGPPAGGALVHFAGWPSVFYLNLPLGAVAIFLAARVFPETRDPRRGADVPGQVLAIAGLAALTYALIEGGRAGWTSPLILGALGVAVAALTGFLLVERRAADPMVPLRLFARPRFASGTAVIFLVGFGLLGSFFFLSLFLQQVQRYSAAESGVRLLPAMAAVVVAAPIAGRLAGRVGSRAPMTAGLALAGTGLLLLVTVGERTPYGSWWPVLVLFGLGLGLTMSPTNAAIIGAVDQRQAGLASAVGMTMQQVGGLIGIALLGSVVGAAGGFVLGMHRAFLIAGAAFLVGAVIAFAFMRERRRVRT